MVNYSSFASFAPHALNQRSPAEGKGKGQKLQMHQKQHALKGQKLLAQGIALGNNGCKPAARLVP